MKQKLQILAFFLVCSSVAIAQTFDVDNLRYTVTSGTNVSVGKTDTNPVGVLTIPATVVNGGTTYSVTAITSYGFQSCSGLTSVTIPNSVTNIGISGFSVCIGLTSITIPNSVTSIESSAFAGCTALQSITLPNSITSIGDYTFRYCGSLNSVVIPNSVTSVGNEAFSNCTMLSSVILSNTLSTIVFGAFADCSSLTSINIPNSVTSIGQYAFYNCSGLTSVNVNWSTPLSIDSTVFQGVNTTVIPLNVPVGSGALYEANSVWTTFNPINAILSSEDFNRTKINVYPNPTTNYIKVSGVLNSETYVIYDMMGRQLQNGLLNNNDTINIENLATGKYLLQFSNGASSTILKN